MAVDKSGWNANSVLGRQFEVFRVASRRHAMYDGASQHFPD